ncbi:MAG: hypothetical protein OXF73_05070 [Gammaproteobacteria bacterium]|nr:hypothetical protein [Gammaproteobacteria bacterium]MCY4227295.1 hypothetical protein [Gammaproteobacteria bacterium]
MPQYGAGGLQASLQTVKRGTPLLLLCLSLAGGLSLFCPLLADTLYEESQRGLSPELRMARTLIKADVLDLAESILENRSPPVLPSDEWLAWERQIWSLYAYRNKWQDLYERAVQVPPSFPESIRNEALDQAAKALVEQARGAEARRLLIRRMVSTQLPVPVIREIRKLIISSYVVDGLLSEAALSMTNYEREFRDSDEDWLIQRAEIFLKLGKPADAVNILAPSSSPRAKLLGLYARLAHQSVTPAQGSQRLDSILSRDEDGKLRPGLTEMEAAAVAAYLGRLIGGHEYVMRLEQYLIVKNEFGTSTDGAFPVFYLSDLIRAYEDYAIQFIGVHGLLENDFPSIYRHLLSLPDNETLQQKALSAFLLNRVENPVQRTRLCDLFVASLNLSGSIELMASLFGTGTPLGELSLGGEAVLLLSNMMIEQGRIQLAVQAIDSMSERAFINVVPDKWMLQKARVYVVSGRFLASFQQLRQMISGFSEISPEQMDEILTVVFDLQKFRQNEYALELLNLLREKATSRKQDRELTYWIGETYQAMHHYLPSASYFLYSAMLENSGYDQWGISARYYAARSLESAHLYADAGKLYESILNHTADEARKAELNQKIQELSLWESGGFDPGNGLVEGGN